MLKISVVYFMWNPEICQDPPTCGQDDLVLFQKLFLLVKTKSPIVQKEVKKNLYLKSGAFLSSPTRFPWLVPLTFWSLVMN